MNLTNAQRGDLIDALHLAGNLLDSLIESELPRRRRDWTPKDRQQYADWDGRRGRYRKLRRAYLAEEKRAR